MLILIAEYCIGCIQANKTWVTQCTDIIKMGQLITIEYCYANLIET